MYSVTQQYVPLLDLLEKHQIDSFIPLSEYMQIQQHSNIKLMVRCRMLMLRCFKGTQVETVGPVHCH